MNLDRGRGQRGPFLFCGSHFRLAQASFRLPHREAGPSCKGRWLNFDMVAINAALIQTCIGCDS